MTDPGATASVLVAELASIECPVTRARQAGAVSQVLRTVLAKMRREAVAEAHAEREVPVPVLAESLDVTPGRIYQLLTELTRAGGTPDPAKRCAAPSTLPVPEPLLPAQRHMTVGGADTNLTVAEATS